MTIERNDIDTRLMDFHLHNQVDEYPAIIGSGPDRFRHTYELGIDVNTDSDDTISES